HDVGPGEVGGAVLAGIRDREPSDESDRQAAVHERFAESGSGCELGIEVNLVRVHRQRREPDVVRLCDGSPDATAKNVADLDVPEETPLPRSIACVQEGNCKTLDGLFPSGTFETDQSKRNVGLRRLIALTSALLFLELLFFGLLSPLLPELRREFDLSTTSVGVLMATYALGALLGAVVALALC